MKYPIVSVIITTHNSQNYLNNCLKSIAEQSYPKNKIEIIVVDNNSTDETKKIAQLYVKKLYNKGKERCSQRNFGANRANRQRRAKKHPRGNKTLVLALFLRSGKLFF